MHANYKAIARCLYSYWLIICVAIIVAKCIATYTYVVTLYAMNVHTFHSNPVCNNSPNHVWGSLIILTYIYTYIPVFMCIALRYQSTLYS